MKTLIKNQLSQELIKELGNLNQTFHALLRIDLQGKKFVILKEDEYLEIMSSLKDRQGNLKDFFQKSPLFGIDLDLERDKTPSREPEL